MHGVLKMRAQRLDTFHHVLAHQNVQCGQSDSAGHRVCRVGVAVGKFKHVIGPALGHEGVVNLFAGQHRTHRLRTIGDLFGAIHDVRCHAKSLGAGVGSHAAKAGNHFVKNQQDVVGGANVAQALQVAVGRDDDTG
ncbi:hypothetical protein GALL_487930 [mine drainage metagenome]|uniref:Uncharacterized protein n=1 Tax=mine drainage metagenome TaxID=410659 RepID=A0A1J5PWB5_9ZZZZ